MRYWACRRWAMSQLKRLDAWRRRERTLPLRTWLVVAVLAIVGTGFLAQFGLTAPISVWEQQAEESRLASVRQIIGTNAARWSDPKWRRHADTSLAALDVDVALFSVQPVESSPRPGQAIYMTAAARRYLDTGSDSGGQAVASAAVSTSPGMQRTNTSAQVAFQRLIIAHPAQSASRPPLGVALLWDTPPVPGELLALIWATVELGSFTLILALVVWLIGQPVLRPLAAMSRAAEDIAGGDLDVHLPPTPVREIAAVGAALQGMSSVLRAALVRQTALEEERRLFVGAIAHDLRTPLFMLRGYLKGLQRGVAATPEKVAHYVEMCRTQADALERLIADLFAFTRLEYLEQEPEHARLELGTLLQETVEGAQPLAAAKAISLTLAAPEDPGARDSFVGDSYLLVRAMNN